ncbi:amino acid deaminase/aldolase [Baekduia sp.]|jgi:D-serine deaminase-like pyridoxal phosphate-dependent protein|uniref:amino acid deaminase/aldolase n=1 Tax=Baekduia sp. TaxID=2600305 RepID=UPI002E0A2588|nr:amino acid deaminase/aldolase [Baekduia sp.]
MLSPAERLARYETAFAGIDAPFAFVDLEAMWSNSASMLARSAGKPIRVASKSLRCRALLRTILDRDAGYQGLLAFTLPEALWLARKGLGNLVVAYPTTDRGALRELGALTAEHPDGAPVVMVDSVEHLDLIAAAAGDVAAPIQVCLDFDASFWTAGSRVKIGAKRSPVRTPEQARALAEAIVARPGFKLAGMMSYEGHIAGQGDRIPGARLKSLAITRMQRTSYAELRERRAAAVAAVLQVAPLAFVNAGGTGDLERVATEPAMTEATAGSGFYAPTLFDNYASFRLEPAAIFALPVSRRPGSGTLTALGGGYLASGAGAKDRMPTPYLPEGLRLDTLEGTGEVQTPLHGKATGGLRIGDNVYFRHAKAGELCERFNTLYLLEGDRIVDEVLTYRGEGQCFL